MYNRGITIEYPASLIKVWAFVNGIEDYPEAEIVALYNGLVYELCKDQHWDARNEPIDYFLHLVQSSCPNHINSCGIMRKDARKFFARRNNPVGYEMNDILHKALLALEKEHKIVRDNDSSGYTIKNHTRFALPATSRLRYGKMSNYEKNCHQVPHFATKFRKDAEHTRMLTHENAKKLVLELLKAFEGWTEKTDLLDAFSKHIPEQFWVINAPDNGWLEALSDGEEDPMLEFYREQASNIVSESSKNIWDKICKISDKVFCLYTLPKVTTDRAPIPLETLGKSSTVSDQNKKLSEILLSELKCNVDEFRNDKKFIRQILTSMIDEIYQNLTGRCAGCGYQVPIGDIV